eukprot:CAMPEP_0174231418 /NCGR_PEP_ID=MMETSP0417-20130205/1947_1 /TAXON_ID=242541 /ORGANISM="Mayorella sp, Strain BSH-02190019" /LENGTH=925 /DNA_ID=CAMNT_0015309299 /DNA_START=125 /DNA_END=2902 /DNA_ORIENTATION=+
MERSRSSCSQFSRAPRSCSPPESAPTAQSTRPPHSRSLSSTSTSSSSSSSPSCRWPRSRDANVDSPQPSSAGPHPRYPARSESPQSSSPFPGVSFTVVSERSGALCSSASASAASASSSSNAPGTTRSVSPLPFNQRRRSSLGDALAGRLRGLRHKRSKEPVSTVLPPLSEASAQYPPRRVRAQSSTATSQRTVDASESSNITTSPTSSKSPNSPASPATTTSFTSSSSFSSSAASALLDGASALLRRSKSTHAYSSDTVVVSDRAIYTGDRRSNRATSPHGISPQVTPPTSPLVAAMPMPMPQAAHDTLEDELVSTLMRPDDWQVGDRASRYRPRQLVARDQKALRTATSAISTPSFPVQAAYPAAAFTASVSAPLLSGGGSSCPGGSTASSSTTIGSGASPFSSSSTEGFGAAIALSDRNEPQMDNLYQSSNTDLSRHSNTTDHHSSSSSSSGSGSSRGTQFQIRTHLQASSRQSSATRTSLADLPTAVALFAQPLIERSPLFCVESGCRSAPQHPSVALIDQGRYTSYYRHYFFGKPHRILLSHRENDEPFFVFLEQHDPAQAHAHAHAHAHDTAPQQPQHLRGFVLSCKPYEKGVCNDEWVIIPSHGKTDKLLKKALRTSLPDLFSSSRKLISVEPTAEKQLLVLRATEELIHTAYNFIILYQPPGSTQSEDCITYSGDVSEAFESFLEFLGSEVDLPTLGDKRRTARHSKFNDYDVYFHPITDLHRSLDPAATSALLSRQLVTIVFSESETPFRPDSVASDVNYVYVVVSPVHHSDFQKPHYKIAVASKGGVHSIYPLLPFPSVFEVDDRLRKFLVAKSINSERSSMYEDRLMAESTAERRAALTTLAACFQEESQTQRKKQAKDQTSARSCTCGCAGQVRRLQEELDAARLELEDLRKQRSRLRADLDRMLESTLLDKP